MQYVITDGCVMCGLCAAQCPAQAIARGGVHNEIDETKCLHCGRCYENCPVGAIEEQ